MWRNAANGPITLQYMPTLWSGTSYIQYTKRKKIAKHFYIQKAKHFSKNYSIPVMFLSKKPYTWRYGIFMKFLKLAFIYKKHDTLRYVTFSIQKARNFAKSKTICDTFLYTKTRHFCVTRFYIEFLKFAFTMSRKVHCKCPHPLRKFQKFNVKSRNAKVPDFFI